jgi:hypothetical protein
LLILSLLANLVLGVVLLVVADAPGPWLSCAFWHGLNATPRPDFLAGAVALGTDCVARLGDVLRRYGMSLDGRRLAG